MSYHVWCWIVRGIGLLGGVILAAGMLNERNALLCLLGGGLLGVALIISAIKLTCPGCGKRIPERINMKINVCPHCGEPLD